MNTIKNKMEISINRPWDKENKYTKGFLKAYKYWTLEVNYRQPTLGCFIIFANRSIERVSEATTEEMAELPLVMKEIESTLEQIEVFHPDGFNYWQMGNKLKHLHFHGIPRYQTPREFGDKIWVDESFGTTPTWVKQDEDDAIVVTIREIVVSNLKY